MQPLDFLLGRYLGINGFGFSVNGTIIDQNGHGRRAGGRGRRRPAHLQRHLLLRESRRQRAALDDLDGGLADRRGANQNGITNAALFSRRLPAVGFLLEPRPLDRSSARRHLPQLTFDVVNIFKEEQRSYFQFENAAFTSYQPGRTVLIGLRGRF